MLRTVIATMIASFLMVNAALAETNFDILQDIRTNTSRTFEPLRDIQTNTSRTFEHIRATHKPIKLIVDYISGDYITHKERDRYNMNVASVYTCKALARNLSTRTARTGTPATRKYPNYIHQLVFTCVDTTTGDIASEGTYLQIPYSTDGKNQPCVKGSAATTVGGFCLNGFAPRTVFIGHFDSSDTFLIEAMKVFENPKLCEGEVRVGLLMWLEACRVSVKGE